MLFCIQEFFILDGELHWWCSWCQCWIALLQTWFFDELFRVTFSRQRIFRCAWSSFQVMRWEMVFPGDASPVGLTSICCWIDEKMLSTSDVCPTKSKCAELNTIVLYKHHLNPWCSHCSPLLRCGSWLHLLVWMYPSRSDDVSPLVLYCIIDVYFFIDSLILHWCQSLLSWSFLCKILQCCEWWDRVVVVPVWSPEDPDMLLSWLACHSSVLWSLHWSP